MANNTGNEEPNTAPVPDRWYNLTLGSSFNDQNPNFQTSKFFTLRYEFKPASIDKSQPGSLKRTRNKVSVEYNNNQPGKPKVAFEGGSEDYKEHDAVLFFDGESFRLEKLHRAVKRLRHVRLPGDSVGASATTASTTLPVAPPLEGDFRSVPSGKGVDLLSVNKGADQQTVAQVEQIGNDDQECIVTNKFSQLPYGKSKDEMSVEPPSPTNPSAASPETKNNEYQELVDLIEGVEDNSGRATEGNASEKRHAVLDIDINLPHQADTDDEIADVDINDDEADKGPNAAEALKAQVNAEGKDVQTSSSSSSSGSDSSGSGSDSVSRSEGSSSDSESSGESVISV